MYVPRIQLDKLLKAPQGKVTVLYGARRTGKTTLLKKLIEGRDDYLFVTGEDLFVSEALSSSSLEKLRAFVGDKKLLIIDEAQYIPDVGKNIKLIIDHIEHLTVVVTGSSTLDIMGQIGEPLTGRQQTLYLFPISQRELSSIESDVDTKARLESRLLYGGYPEVITLESDRDREAYLRELVSSYLLKDILSFEGVQKAKKLVDLLILLAFQIGKEVSHAELATTLSLNKATVERYLDLLEKAFVIFPIRGFSRNLRKEVTKSPRYYFYDIGIRNAIIANFNRLDRRDDVGMVWENYLACERIKKQHYDSIWSNNYFWRTYDQKEIDWVEERGGMIHGYEFKWGRTAVKAPKLWFDAYPNATFEVVSKENYYAFIT